MRLCINPVIQTFTIPISGQRIPNADHASDLPRNLNGVKLHSHGYGIAISRLTLS